jgi:hypothetical protein
VAVIRSKQKDDAKIRLAAADRRFLAAPEAELSLRDCFDYN